MAIVEDEVRNESEEENEIEVVIEEDDGDRDSDDSEDEDDDLESKVKDLENRISEYPYNYDEHIDLIQALWRLSELERWRSAFERLQQLTILDPEHWLIRLQTEVTLAHTDQDKEMVSELFNQALLDCYSVPILSEWCTWLLSGGGGIDNIRSELHELLRRAGPDPLSGKIFWDAKLELEKAQLESMNEDHPEFKAQQERVLFCLEETVSRPLLRNEEAWEAFEKLALSLHDQNYVDKIKKQHDAAQDYLQKVTIFEDKLLTLESHEEKAKVYQDYVDVVMDLALEDKYADCDNDGILKVLFDRASTDCRFSGVKMAFLRGFAKHAMDRLSRATYTRVLQTCVRRCPRRDTFWALLIQHSEHQGNTFDEVKAIFETALSKVMETYRDAECLWLAYLEYLRRQTSFDNEEQVTRLRLNFRLAWDTLAETWGEQSNDCEIPFFWARLEYNRMNDPKQGKEIFEEIFKYGQNKSLARNWESFIELESERLSAHKRRELYRRALRFVDDYPTTIVRLWTDYERDFGQLDTMRECISACEDKMHEWRHKYEANQSYSKHKGKPMDKKAKFDKRKKKKEDEPKNQNKRKLNEASEESESKKKKENEMEVDTGTSTLKRTHEGDNHDSEASSSKRPKTEENPSSQPPGSRDDCTLFVSNLEFKVDEQKLRAALSQYGEIVSFRLRAGVKAFGGSICYCQYNSQESVDEALKHDREPLDGRPMFLSRYSAKKGKADFKYSTGAEKNKLFVKNLPFSHCNKEALTKVFEEYGKLKDVRVVTYKDGRPKGLAYIDYEDEEAASKAIKGTDGVELNGRRLAVAVSEPPPKGAATLGQPKKDTGKGMRRTQLSSFIPSVLQKPSTSTSANGHSSQGKQSLSNSDFRSMLLKK